MDAINQALQVAEGSGVNQGSKFRSRQTPQPNRSMGRNGTLGLPRRTMRTKLCVTQDGCSFRQSGQLNLQQMKDDIASMHSCELSGPSRRSLFLLLLPASAAGSACADEDGDDDGDFYTQWPYQKASDIIPYVESHSTPGDSESVLMAMDSFGERSADQALLRPRPLPPCLQSRH